MEKKVWKKKQLFDYNPNHWFDFSDEQKLSPPSPSPNLIQKLLFRQFSPKTRPYSMGISVNPSSNDSLSYFIHFLLVRWECISNNNIKWNLHVRKNELFHAYHFLISIRRISNPTTVKQSLTNSKQNVRHAEENSFLSSSNKILSKSQQSDLDSYLSKRRNTTGSISLNKIIDLKNNIPNGSTFTNSNNRISTESNFEKWIEKNKFFFFSKIFFKQLKIRIFSQPNN